MLTTVEDLSQQNMSVFVRRRLGLMKPECEQHDEENGFNTLNQNSQRGL